MGHLSTHVLNTANGCPAAGMQVTLQRLDGDTATTIRAFALNADGRHDGGPLLEAQAMVAGRYRLLFAVAPYFRALGTALPEPPSIDTVQLDFGIANADGHYHVLTWAVKVPRSGCPAAMGSRAETRRSRSDRGRSSCRLPATASPGGSGLAGHSGCVRCAVSR